MKNIIGIKHTNTLKPLKLHKINSNFHINKPSLFGEKTQDDYKIQKKSTLSFNKKQNHRSFFLNLLKKRNLIKKILKKEISIERVIELFSKDNNLRTSIENKEIGIYLSNKIDFFKKIKEEDGWSKLDKVINICHLKKYINDDIIINYEEKESKVFLLLKGKIGIYKPIFVEKTMALKEFLQILNSIENKENNFTKYNRIKEKNKENSLDISFYEKMNNNEGVMLQFFDFLLEDYEKIGNISEGQLFGAKIYENKNKNNISDKTIKSEKESIVVFFEIEEFRKILKRYEGKKYIKEIEKFKDDFAFFKFFSDEKIIDIFKKLSTKTLYKDEYLYKQNDIDDKIYFILKGKFKMYSSISFNWLIEYLDYIKDSKTNLIYHLIKKLPKNKEECKELFEEIKNKVIKSPMIYETTSSIDKINEKLNENCIYGVKKEEEDINNAKVLFKINIKEIKSGDMVGMEDSLEFKNRYCSVKCISNVGEVNYISIFDLMKIIKIYNNENNYMNNHLLEFNSKLKFMLYQQIIKDVQNLENKLTSEFDNKYNDLIKPNDNNKSLNQKNLSIAAIKVKGFKYDIKEVFDKSIPIFPNIKKSNKENIFEKNLLLLNNLLGSPSKKTRRIFKYKKTKSKPILTLSNPNTFSINSENNNKEYSTLHKSERNLTEQLITYVSRKKNDISLSTNVTNNLNNPIDNFNHSKNSIFRKKMRLNYNRFIKNQTIQNYLNSFDAKEANNNKKNNLYQNFNYLKEKKINNYLLNSSPLSESKNGRNDKFNYTYEGKKRNCKSMKNIKNNKMHKDCIESILNEKFGQINKKYYLGNHFKNRLDTEKKKFNLIHYKDYFNKI